MHESERILPKSKIKQQKIARRAAKTNAASSIDRQRGEESRRETERQGSQTTNVWGNRARHATLFALFFQLTRPRFYVASYHIKRVSCRRVRAGKAWQTVPVIQFGFFMQPRVFLIKCRIMNFTCERGRQRERERGGASSRPLKF